MTTTTFTIDCDTCPGRGRLCGDCFVPVLGRVWLQDPQVRPDTPEPGGRPGQRVHPAREHDPGVEEMSRGVPLDTDELAAVSAFVRAGLVDPAQAAQARAQLTGSARFAAG